MPELVKVEWLIEEASLLNAWEEIEWGAQAQKRPDGHVAIAERGWIVPCLRVYGMEPPDDREAHSVGIRCPQDRW
jgi:hypothetical protein